MRMKLILTVLLISLLLNISNSFINVVNAATLYSGGDGSSGNPYQITTAAQLAGLATDVNAGLDTTGKYYKLMNDISLSSYSTWTPIGKSYTEAFKGYFNGDNYKVTDLTILSATTMSGLFGCVNLGSIQNIGVENVNITVNNSGVMYVGGLVGVYRFSNMYNCYSTGNIKINTDTVESVGGLIGLHGDGNGQIVSQCYSSVNIDGNSYYGSHVGGLIGYANNPVNMSYAVGNVNGGKYVGGLIGYCNVYTSYLIEYCYSSGLVTGGSSVGGFVGYTNKSKIGNTNYWDIESSGNATGYGSAQLGNWAAIGLTTLQAKNYSAYIGWDFLGVWGISAGVNNGYPYLRALVTLKAPNIPTGFTNPIATTKVKGGNMNISWGATSNWQTGSTTSRQYELQFYNGSSWSSSVFTLKTSNPITSYTYNIPNNINVVTVMFQVRAVTDHGSSNWIQSPQFMVDNVEPNVITPIVTVNSSTQITVSGTTTDALSGLHVTQPYNIGYKKVTDSNWIDIGWSNVSSSTITGLDINTLYNFRIQAQDIVGNINSGNIVSKYTLANIPQNIVFSNILDKSLTIIFNINSNPSYTQYYVERASNSSFTSPLIVQNWNTVINLNQTGLSEGTEYYYRVKARNGDNIETSYNTYNSQKTSTPPMVNNVVLTGIFKIEQPVTVEYNYSDVDNDLELGTIYNWYRDAILFATNTNKTYILKEEDKFKNISVEVIPKSERVGENIGIEMKSSNYYILPSVGNVSIIVKDTIGNLLDNVQIVINS